MADTDGGRRRRATPRPEEEAPRTGRARKSPPAPRKAPAARASTGRKADAQPAPADSTRARKAPAKRASKRVEAPPAEAEVQVEAASAPGPPAKRATRARKTAAKASAGRAAKRAPAARKRGASRGRAAPAVEEGTLQDRVAAGEAELGLDADDDLDTADDTQSYSFVDADVELDGLDLADLDDDAAGAQDLDDETFEPEEPEEWAPEPPPRARSQTAGSRARKAVTPQPAETRNIRAVLAAAAAAAERDETRAMSMRGLGTETPPLPATPPPPPSAPPSPPPPSAWAAPRAEAPADETDEDVARSTPPPPPPSPPPEPVKPAEPAAPEAKKVKERKPRAEKTEGDGRPKLKATGIIIGAAVVVVLLLVAGGLLLKNILDESGVKYSELKAGDCFQEPSGRFNNVDTVPCEEEHDLEVFAVLEHPDAPEAPFPGMDVLVRYANPQCLSQFQAYAGVAFDQVNLRDVYITPRESAWKDGARRLVCAVGSEDDQPRTASIRAGGA